MKRSYRPKLIDRLSSVSDALIFTLAFMIGSISLVILRLAFDANVLLATLVPLSMLSVYSFLVWARPNKVREDRAADNLYYLGFLFTVVSLGIALYRYGSDAQGVNQIVSDLGIGLSTTVVGLFFRILFSQLRIDPVEVEEQARAELSASIEKFRMDVRSMSEVVRVSHTVVDQHIKESIEKFDSVVEKSVQSLEKVDKKIGDIKIPPELFKLNLEESEHAILQSVQTVCDKMEKIEINFDSVIEKAANGVEAVIKSLSVDAIALNDSSENIINISSTVTSAANAAQANAENLRKVIADHEALELKLKELLESSFRAESITYYMSSVQDIMRTVSQDVKHHTEKFVLNIDSINRELANSDSVVASSNEGLAKLAYNMQKISLEFGNILQELKQFSADNSITKIKKPYAEEEY